MAGSVIEINQSRIFIFKYLGLSFAGFVCASAIYFSVVYLGYHFEKKTFNQLLIDENRNYEQAPFDMVDATRYCKLKTEVRYGGKLAQSYVDEISTRIDDVSGIYKVFLIATIGDKLNQEERLVHCFVDANERVVVHYRSLDRYPTSLVSKAMQFFK